jgi:dihydrofolate reductase
MVGGGTGVYEAAMPYATHQVLTEVHQSPVGDTYFPGYPGHGGARDVQRPTWRETRREDHDGYSWVWWERVGPAPGH